MRQTFLALAFAFALALAPASAQIVMPGGGGGGGTASGPAGGDLSGTYPNPTVTNGSHITNASITNSGLATPAPCSAFGTSTGQCAQGGTITAGGPTGSATVAPVITYNAAGQLTTVTSATITPAIGSVTGLGTGVATALGNATNATGGPLTATTACQSWTPTDQSGAALTFSAVSAQYCQYGNIVYIYGKLTYPSTANGSTAVISLPVAVPNQNYADSTECVASSASTSLILFPKIATSTAEIAGFTTQNVVTNATLSASVFRFSCWYPAS